MPIKSENISPFLDTKIPVVLVSTPAEVHLSLNKIGKKFHCFLELVGLPIKLFGVDIIAGHINYLSSELSSEEESKYISEFFFSSKEKDMMNIAESILDITERWEMTISIYYKAVSFTFHGEISRKKKLKITMESPIGAIILMGKNSELTIIRNLYHIIPVMKRESLIGQLLLTWRFLKENFFVKITKGIVFVIISFFLMLALLILLIILLVVMVVKAFWWAIKKIFIVLFKKKDHE